MSFWAEGQRYDYDYEMCGGGMVVVVTGFKFQRGVWTNYMYDGELKQNTVERVMTPLRKTCS